MFKINESVFLEKNRLYHRVWFSGLHDADPDGCTPSVDMVNRFGDSPGREAVRLSSHEFDLDRI